ncbi:T-complex protein 11 [Desmophyllum pertusum]|uniref:T-complex protein 11 n=1 Tax=Desmophyllum pertusum TaxID=174260 RepID=A0A9W9ZMG0_9CNID|nr:T-complex protein 11 [Desmophyllum pertusum]
MDGLQDGENPPDGAENAQKKTANIVSHMALAHELLMDDSFKIQSGLPQNSLERQVRDVIHKAFWDKLREELNQKPAVFSQALSLIKEVKENMILLLLPYHNSLRAHINEVLDLDLITQQANHGILDISKLAQSVVGILSKMCAPARDEQAKKILENQDIVDLFKEVFSLMDAMKVDMANFQLQTIKPHLVQQSAEFERKKFKDYLQTNPAGLMSTKVWLKRGAEVAAGIGSKSAAQVSAEALDTTDFKQKLQDASLPDALVHGYLGIIFGEPGWPYPETLIMDEFRLSEMRWSVRRTSLIASVLLVTLNTVGQQLASDAAYLATLKEVLYILLDGVPEGDFPSALPGVYDQIVQETEKLLEARGLSQLTSQQRDMLKGQTEGITSPDSTVLNLITTRAYDFMLTSIKTRLLQKSSREGGQSTLPIIPQGLASVNTELSEITGRFSRVVGHNMAVFGPFYEDILVEIKSS